MTAYDFQTIENRKKTNLHVEPMMISRDIKYELRDKKNFSDAKTLFEYLKEILDEKKKANEEYSDSDIIAFQRAVGALVRYAPTTKDSRYYFDLTLSEFTKPLRTFEFELLLLNNFIYAHTSKGEMDDVLVLVKTALEIRVFRMDGTEYDPHYPSYFEHPLYVFLIESRKVLHYHGLEYNNDVTDIRKIIK